MTYTSVTIRWKPKNSCYYVEESHKDHVVPGMSGTWEGSGTVGYVQEIDEYLVLIGHGLLPVKAVAKSMAELIKILQEKYQCQVTFLPKQRHTSTNRHTHGGISQ